MPVRAILKSISQLRFNNNWWCSRAILMTIGQLCFYDQIKQTLLASGLFGDNLVTHFTSSLGAVEMLFFFPGIWKPCFQNGSTTFPRVPSPRRWPSRLMCSKRGQWTQSQVLLSRLHLNSSLQTLFPFIFNYLNFLFLTFSISQESSPAQ